MNKVKREVKKKFIVQAIINKIEEENKGSDIKTALVEGYHKPDKIVKKENKEEGYIPDVVAEKNGSKDLYEVELNEKDYVLDKWKLFSHYSNKSEGSFNIVVPEKNLDLIKSLLRENKISARLIYYA